MLNKENRLKQDVSFVFRKGIRYHSDLLTLYLVKTDDSQQKIAFIVTKKAGGAVQRNLIKRRLRSIVNIMLPLMKKGFLINLYTNTSKGKWKDVPSYETLKEQVHDLLQQSDILHQ